MMELQAKSVKPEERDRLDHVVNQAQLEYPAFPDLKVKVDPKVNQELQELTARAEEPVSKDRPVKLDAPDHPVHPVLTEIWALMVHPVSKATEAVKERLEQLVSPECLEPKDHPDCQDLSVLKEHPVDLVMGELTVPQAKKAVKALVGHSVIPEEREEEAEEVQPVAKETKDGEVRPGQWVRPGQSDHKVNSVSMERKDLLDLLVVPDPVAVPDLKDPLEPWDQVVAVELKDPLVHADKTVWKVYLDQLDHPGHQDHPDHQAWKPVVPELSPILSQRERWKRGRRTVTMVTTTDTTRAKRGETNTPSNRKISSCLIM